MVFFFAHWRFVFSEIRCLDRPFAFFWGGGYFRVRFSYKNLFKNLKNVYKNKKTF